MVNQVIINLFGGLSPLCLQLSDKVSIASLQRHLSELTSIPIEDQYLTTVGGRIPRDEYLYGDGPVVFNLGVRLLGGKGGFGSNLRAAGGRMASRKTTNFEACRDLNGRRLRTLNTAKQIADYMEKETEIKEEREKRIRKKIEDGLKEPPQKRYRFEDHKFLEESSEQVEEVKDAVAEAMKLKRTSGESSKSASPPSSSSSPNSGSGANDVFSMWDDISDYSSGDEEEKEEEVEENIAVKGKGKKAVEISEAIIKEKGAAITSHA
ncbi:uncharacterized protein VTP21DRAFT_10699 [Calcarisporiella thermophila]|uniref:uncharacterized protein n=1 Tax=Calcarisporiella thermophila TaxID=911321 RepID=UPI003742D7B2